MGIRQRAYWLRQAEAVRRQYVATVAHAISLVFADENSKDRMIDELELSDMKEASKEKRSKAMWDMLFFMKGGKGV